MKFVFQVIKKVEVAKFKSNTLAFLTRNPSHILLIVSGILLAYAIYVGLSLQMILNMELQTDTILINIIRFGLILSTLFVIITRNSFKDNNNIFFYLNTKIKAYQLIFISIVLHSFFYFFIFLLFISPILIGYLITDFTINYFYLLLITIFLFICYFISITFWMLNKVIVQKILGTKERFWINAFLQTIIIAGLVYLVKPFIDSLVVSWLLHLIIVLMVGTIVSYVFVNISLPFLIITFKEKDTGTLSSKYKKTKFNYSNKFLLHTKLEAIHISRNQIFKEQSFFFIILILFVIVFNQIFDPLNFSTFYSILLNFGLKEIVLLLPLTIGIHYREYLSDVYHLNATKYNYFLPRLLLIFLLNCLTFTLFIAFTSIITEVNMTDLHEVLFLIIFVTMLSSLIGFMVNITEGNRIYIILLLLVVINFFDFALRQLATDSLIVNFTYLSAAVIMFFVIELYYLRRPIVR